MQKESVYDIAFYPQYNIKTKKPVLGLGLICKKTEVEVIARLAKLTDN